MTGPGETLALVLARGILGRRKLGAYGSVLSGLPPFDLPWLLAELGGPGKGLRDAGGQACRSHHLGPRGRLG